MTIKRLMASLTTMFVTFFGVAISAVAIPAYAQAAVCGFEGLNTGGLGAGSGGYYAEANYTSCNKSTNQKVQVNYTYASRSKCFSPGTTKIYANPDLGALRSTNVLGTC